MSGSMVTSVLTIIGLLLTFASVTFAARELRQSRQTSQSEFLFNILTWYLNDPGLREFFYKLDYNRWKFDKNTFSGSEEEPHLDKMLYVFDLLERLIESKQISPNDLNIVSFEASRVLRNAQVERYLSWLDEAFREVGQLGPAYAAARRLGNRLQYGEARARHVPIRALDRGESRSAGDS